MPERALRSDGTPYEVACHYLHIENNEDCIKGGSIGRRWPYLIIADGTSAIEDPVTHNLRFGESSLTPEFASSTAEKFLLQEVPRVRSLEEMLRGMRSMFDEVVKGLRSYEYQGATTLLVSLLWGAPESRDMYWCYGYEGTGSINILSPERRRLVNLVLSEQLLSPQRNNYTAVLRREGASVAPAIAARLHEPGDILYAGSDGINPLNRWLMDAHKITLPYYILENHHDPDFPAILNQCPTFNDDAVLGYIA